MARFRVEFSIETLPFDDDCTGECARILRDLADRIENQTCVGEMEHDGAQLGLTDIDGNEVGNAWVR